MIRLSERRGFPEKKMEKERGVTRLKSERIKDKGDPRKRREGREKEGVNTVTEIEKR